MNGLRRLPFVCLTVLILVGAPCIAAEKPRLLVLTDIGGDPDDTQSLIRLLVHANEFDIEGLVATASGVPGELKADVVKPELIREVVKAYGQVQPNLVKHHPGFPTEKALLDVVKSGNPKRGVESVGEGHDTEGSAWIVAAAERDDERPLNVVIWGGSTDLAQALWRVRKDHTAEKAKALLGRVRVYDVDQQDGAGPWILDNFPDLFYVLAKAGKGRDKREGGYRGMYLGGDERLTSREWVDAHVRQDHGALGKLYPDKTWTAPNPHGVLKEGDTPSWFYFLPVGLGDPAHPEWGGWGGRFRPAGGGLYRDAADTVGDVTDARAAVWRWRPAFQAEFQARMDWCFKPFAGANHPPVAAFGKDASRDVVRLTARPGEKVALTAAGSSDPDGNALAFRWFVYPEAGTYEGPVKLQDATGRDATMEVPGDAAGKSLHVILEVTDDGTPPLTRYRRVVVEVRVSR